ncbi:LOW QUALITY PROTEIN: hypothetical protein U9M48_005009 [Paspalum notatum var. saurae]|uniref:Uncharacterized protein n=1 Tax=Paspalum notatum var. saurae TaxID=547442 RepID=A0AAQ3PUI4_PASNO
MGVKNTVCALGRITRGGRPTAAEKPAPVSLRATGTGSPSQIMAAPGNDGGDTAVGSDAAGAGRRWSLRGMTALVTGGTRGIGRAVVEELAALGAAVHTCSRNEPELRARLADWDAAAGAGAEGEGLHLRGAVTGSVCDVSVREQRERLIRDSAARFGGRLSVLVNNVGTNVVRPTTEYSAEKYSLIMATNLESAYHLCQLAHPLLAAASRGSAGGSVVLVSSVCGVVAVDAVSIYAMTKEPGVRVGERRDQGELRRAMVHQDPAHDGRGCITRGGRRRQRNLHQRTCCRHKITIMAAPGKDDAAVGSDAGGAGRRWSLRGMTALVTGGTRGIGRAVVEELAALGAAVHTCSRNESELRARLADWDATTTAAAEGEGLRLRGAVTGSVCDVSVRERLVGDAAARFGGRLSVLVNNVGTNVVRPTKEYSAEEYSCIMATNLESVYHLCQLAAASRGSVVLVSSVCGVVAVDAGSIYAMTKDLHGLVGSAACRFCRGRSTWRASCAGRRSGASASRRRSRRWWRSSACPAPPISPTIAVDGGMTVNGLYPDQQDD